MGGRSHFRWYIVPLYVEKMIRHHRKRVHYLSETDCRCNLSFVMMDLEAKGEKKNLRGFLGQGFQK